MSGIQPRPKRGLGTSKTPVFAVLQRGGNARARVMPTVNVKNIQAVLTEVAEPTVRAMTDSLPPYVPALRDIVDSHESVNHGAGEYARGDVHTNGAEGFFSILKRGIHGIYHSISREHLYRYLAEFEFRYNGRFLNDGERTVLAMKSAEGKRLMYKQPAGET